MSTALQDFFTSYETRPVSRECQKQLGELLTQCPPAEAECFLLDYHPTKLHLRLLRALAARTIGSFSVLREGVTSESKELSKFCAQSASLFSGANNELGDPDMLLPLLQTVSYLTRNQIVSNLARHMTDGDEGKADRLFELITELWGPAAARPLLCRTSEAVIMRELGNGRSLSSFQILEIHRRFPKLAMRLLENVSLRSFSRKAAQFIVRNNLPESLAFCLKNPYARLLSNSTMKHVLRKYEDVFMASALEWSLTRYTLRLKKVLRPETFELFVLKWVESMLKESQCSTINEEGYFLDLSPKEVSSLMSKVDWQAFDGFWGSHRGLLKLMDAADRNRIAAELFEKTKAIDWASCMTCDRSIPIIKERLASEADAHSRARLVRLLLATVETNKDKKALEEICEFVTVRYRNDRDVLNSFYKYLPEMTAADEKTWALVYSSAVELLDTSGSNHCYGMGSIFSAALKRNGKAGLKIYIGRFFEQRLFTYPDKDFNDLDPDLREECISLIFTDANIASNDPERKRCLTYFLPVISKWNTNPAHRIRSENVNRFVLDNLENHDAIAFVLKKRNGFTIESIKQCFEKTGNSDLLRYMMHRNPEQLAVTREAVDKMMGLRSCWRYVKLLKTLRRKGYQDVLKHFRDRSLATIRDPERPTLRHAIVVLSLTTCDTDELLREIVPLLSAMNPRHGLAAPFLPHPEPVGCQDLNDFMKRAKQIDSIYRGVGSSFSFVDDPSSIVHLLSKFCINGDMMLFVRDSVYSVGLSLPSAGAKALLSELVHKPVSVMKYALRIHRLVSSVEAQREFLTQLAKTETHTTLRTCFFEYALSSLDDTKNVGIWEAVKEMMLRLTPKDYALVTLLQGKNVPAQFWEEFVRLLLEKTESLEDNTIENVSIILDRISNSISTMPISHQFHESLLKDYFLSERYFRCTQSHDSVCNLFTAYLVRRSPTADLQADVARKKALLAERLTTTATREAIIAYNSDLGHHPTTTLLNQLVQRFSSACRDQKLRSDTENELQLSSYLETLLGFFTSFNGNLLFGPCVCLSLTAITCRQVDGHDLEQTEGALVAQFIDRVYTKNPGLARKALPDLFESYFNGRTIDARFLEDILHPPESHNPDLLMIRLVIVTKILPRNWKEDRSFKSFREKFLVLVRNTPCERILYEWL